MEWQPIWGEDHRVKILPTTSQPTFCHQDLQNRHNEIYDSPFHTMAICIIYAGT
jgi:hypothetical protein